MMFSRRSIKFVSSKSSALTSSTLTPSLPTISVGLTVLHSPDEDESALVDIITVHGLSGHPQNTWTNFTTEHYWPLNSLPEDIPRSRIMTFGYDTSISPFSGNTTIISDISKQLISHLINKRTSDGQRKRPIIFIAHSLGGIVIKEFLHIASNTGHEELASCVCGILFLGTPHRGSYTASFMDVVSGVLKPLLGRPADIVIKDLSTNSRHLQELDQLLRFRLAKIDIYSFYELLPMSPMKSPIVERHSAVLNIPSELEQIGLDADHRQICKPPDRHHFIYETIAQRIISVMNRQIDKAQYSNDLVEMTNNFATKQMNHILALTKELHEGQTGPNLTSMFIFQQMSSDPISQTREPEVTHTHGFEEVLKSLPVHQVKIFVGGIQKLMDRAKSLQDLLLETERQNERRKAEARIEEERRISAQRFQKLEAENIQLRAMLRRGRCTHISPPRKASRKTWHHELGMAQPDGEPPATSDEEVIPEVKLTDDNYFAAALGYLDSFVPPISTPCGLQQPSLPRRSLRPQIGASPAQPPPKPYHEVEYSSDMQSHNPGSHIENDIWVPLFNDTSCGMPLAGRGTSNSASQGSQPARQATPQASPTSSNDTSWNEVPEQRRRSTRRTEAGKSRDSYDKNKMLPGNPSPLASPSEQGGLTSTELPRGNQGEVLADNRAQMQEMVERLGEMLRIGQHVLQSGEPEPEPSWPSDRVDGMDYA